MSFHPLLPADYRRYRHYFTEQPHELCEYCLATIIVWANPEYQPMAMERDDMLVISARFSHRRELDHLILPVAGRRLPTPEYLYELAVELGFTAYWFVPEAYLDHWGRPRLEHLFQIAEQSAYHDYVYRQEDLARLPGNRYAKKRNLINQFLKRYEDRHVLEPLSPANTADCLAFLEAWCAERECDEGLEDSLTCERLAAEKMLANLEYFDSRGLVLRVDGEVAAFAVASTLTTDMGVLQFEKAYSHYKGLYQYFDRECARRLFAGRSFINKESDMGVEGLARAKASYLPVRRVRSFQLTLAEIR